MKILTGIAIGIGGVIIWSKTWRAFMGWALSRGDSPARRDT